MQDDLKGSRFYVGVKQSTEAVLNGSAQRAYVAEDADEAVKLPFEELCKENLIPIEYVETKQQLGKACGISVGAACAVVLRQI